MSKNKQLVIYGVGETAEMIADYFMRDSDYEVVAFTVDAAYKKADSLLGRATTCLQPHRLAS
jgi:FlaA1/EpsC-like NDP-sugar epimerase